YVNACLLCTYTRESFQVEHMFVTTTSRATKGGCAGKSMNTRVHPWICPHVSQLLNSSRVPRDMRRAPAKWLGRSPIRTNDRADMTGPRSVRPLSPRTHPRNRYPAGSARC